MTTSRKALSLLTALLALTVPVLSQNPRWTATGNITSAASIVSVNSHDFALATVTIHGTYAGVTLVFEFSDDGGTTWYQDQCVRSDTPIMENGESVTNNSALEWDCGVAATTNFRVRSTSWTSGTGVIGITMTQDQIEPASTTSIANQATSVQILNAAGSPTTTKTTPGMVFGASLVNNNAAVVFVEFFNTTSPTLGTTTPVLVLVIPASGTLTLSPTDTGMVYNTTDISVAAVTAYNGTTPGSVTGSVFYK
jgi:hypothetical protein